MTVAAPRKPVQARPRFIRRQAEMDLGRPGSERPRVLLITEGTYPYAVGGVSSWCDLLLQSLTEIEWQVLPIIAAHGRPPAYELPPHARLVGPIELWSEDLPPGRSIHRTRSDGAESIPETLVRGLIAWDGDLTAATGALVQCRNDPHGTRRSFRSQHGWASFLFGTAGGPRGAR